MTEKAVLTFDMDGVLCRPPFGINPGKGRGKNRESPGKKNVLWRTETWRYTGRRPMPGAVEGFRQLAETFDCQVLTARAEHSREPTERWFARYFGLVPIIHMRPHWRETPAQFKVRKVTELHARAHFEDDPHTAVWIAEILPAVFLVDWRRNRHLVAPNVHRVRKIVEAAPLLAGLAPG